MRDSNIIGEQLVEIAEVKYAQLKGLQSCGSESARLEFQTKTAYAILYAVGLVIGDHLDELGLDVDALWAAVDPDNAD